MKAKKSLLEYNRDAIKRHVMGRLYVRASYLILGGGISLLLVGTLGSAALPLSAGLLLLSAMLFKRSRDEVYLREVPKPIVNWLGRLDWQNGEACVDLFLRSHAVSYVAVMHAMNEEIKARELR